jgi:hypothetical protein
VAFRSPGAGALAVDHLDRWTAFRAIDAVAGCALDGRWCGTDLSRTGTRPDRSPLRAAVVSDLPVDAGPAATFECDSALNPRPCP